MSQVSLWGAGLEGSRSEGITAGERSRSSGCPGAPADLAGRGALAPREPCEQALFQGATRPSFFWGFVPGGHVPNTDGREVSYILNKDLLDLKRISPYPSL